VLGIPNSDQINQIVTNALNKIQGLEGKTAEDVHTEITTALQDLIEVERPVQELLAEIQGLRLLLERLDGAIVTTTINLAARKQG